MQLSDKGAMALICREGIALGWYKDTEGVLTIGIGHTAAAGEPSMPSQSAVLTVSGAFDLFRKDVRQYELAVLQVVDGPMEQHQFDAFVSICYNIGVTAFKRSTFVKRFNKRDIGGCASAIMMWNKPVKIIGRRRGERDQFLHGLPLNYKFMAVVYQPGRNWKLGKSSVIDLPAALLLDRAPEPRLPAPAEVPLPPERQQPDDPGPKPQAPSDTAAGCRAATVTIIGAVVLALILVPFIFGG